MKKILWIMLLCLSLAILAGCQTERDKIMGQWYAQVDVSHRLQQRLEEESPDFAPYMHGVDFFVRIQLTFFADGTYRCELDRDSVEAAASVYEQTLESAVWLYLQDIHQKKNTGISLEAWLQSMNITRSQLLEEVIGGSLAQEVVLELNLQKEGRFTIEKGKLCFSRSPSREPGEKSFHRCVVEEKVLTIMPGTYETQKDKDYFETCLPMEFQK